MLFASWRAKAIVLLRPRGKDARHAPTTLLSPLALLLAAGLRALALVPPSSPSSSSSSSSSAPVLPACPSLLVLPLAPDRANMLLKVRLQEGDDADTGVGTPVSDPSRPLLLPLSSPLPPAVAPPPRDLGRRPLPIRCRKAPAAAVGDPGVPLAPALGEDTLLEELLLMLRGLVTLAPASSSSSPPGRAGGPTPLWSLSGAWGGGGPVTRRGGVGLVSSMGGDADPRRPLPPARAPLPLLPLLPSPSMWPGLLTAGLPAAELPPPATAPGPEAGPTASGESWLPATLLLSMSVEGMPGVLIRCPSLSSLWSLSGA